MNDDNNVFGSHQVRQSLESFLEKALQSRVLEPKELFVRAEVHSQNSFMQFEKRRRGMMADESGMAITQTGIIP